MNKYLYLLKNLSVVAVGQISGKLIVFFMVPIYTSCLTTEEYGTFDYINTIIMLGIPLLTLEIQTAVTRFTIDQVSTERRKILTNVLLINMIGIVLFLGVVILNYYLNISLTLKKYSQIAFFLFFMNSIYNTLSEFARGIERIKTLTIISVISTITTVLLNIVFLIVWKMGLIGFFYANLAGLFVGNCLLIYALDIFDNIDYRNISRIIQKKLISFSAPMVFNSISWWINGMVDRYVIIYFCGLAANGLYAVSFKFVSVFVVFQGIFSQAWVISGLKEYKKNDGAYFFKRIHDLYFMSLVMLLLLLFVCLKPISELLFRGEFYAAWKYVPFLMIASFFGALSGFLGVVFSAANKTRAFASTTIIGAAVNVLLNILLVPDYEGVGAAFSALISGFLVWISRVKISANYIDVVWVNGKQILALIIIVGFSVMITMEVEYIFNGVVLYALILVLLYLFKEHYITMYRKMHNRLYR